MYGHRKNWLVDLRGLFSLTQQNCYSEDFGLSNARRLLDKYRPHIPCFNDDVQGTGCVTLAALLAGLHVSNVSLRDVRVAIFGSGTAGTGIADQIVDAIATESGKSKEEASKQLWYVTRMGNRDKGDVLL